MAVLFRDDAALLFIDDKSKIPIGKYYAIIMYMHVNCVLFNIYRGTQLPY